MARKKYKNFKVEQEELKPITIGVFESRKKTSLSIFVILTLFVLFVIFLPEISEKVNMPCIADDSGLCIDKYDGWPGVHTARFLGENSTSKQRNEYILEKMKNLEGNERKARVECCVVYYDNEGKEEKYIVGKGEIKGKIARNPRGTNGFGFDEIFELEDGRTFAELSAEEKNKISHRKLALQDLLNNM